VSEFESPESQETCRCLSLEKCGEEKVKKSKWCQQQIGTSPTVCLGAATNAVASETATCSSGRFEKDQYFHFCCVPLEVELYEP
jgi:hypothetical protein